MKELIQINVSIIKKNKLKKDAKDKDLTLTALMNIIINDYIEKNKL